MKAVKKFWRKLSRASADDRGSALIVVTLLLALLTIYVSASLTASTTDVIASNFEAAQQKGFYTAYSKLEQMSSDFSKLFLAAIAPGYNKMCQVVVADPSLLNQFRIVKPNVSCTGTGCTPSYTGKFTGGTDIYDLGWVGDTRPFCLIDVCNPNAAPKCNFPPRPPVPIQVEKGDFAGLQGFARRYRVTATAVSENRGGADVQITRDFDNILLPLFQFGIFSDADFELYIPPNWAFGGWVHTNGDFYLTGGDNIAGGPRNVFSQYIYDRNGNLVPTAARITVAKHIVLDNQKNGRNIPGSYMLVYRDSDPANAEKVQDGSALVGALVNNCNGIIDPTFEAKPGNCGLFRGTSAGTVKIGVRKLQLPLQNVLKASPIELIKRGLATDSDPANESPLISARYYYKPGIRFTLADYQNQLPRTVRSGDDPAAGGGSYGGIQLDGADPWLADNVGGSGPGLAKTGSTGNPNWYYQRDSNNKMWPIPRGFQPKIKSSSNGRPTGARLNGYRVHGWIKVELVKIDPSNQNKTITFDITEEILNLGVTVPYRNGGGSFYYPRTPAGFPGGGPGAIPDENSIIHLQRFAAPYTNTVLPGLAALPTTPVEPAIEDVGGANGVNFDYYASMALRAYNNTSLSMFGIEDNLGTTPGITPAPPPQYITRYVDIGANKSRVPYSEPQPDPGGYYTDVARVPVPTSNSPRSEIDFTGLGSSSRPAVNNFLGLPGLSENVNLPKNRNTFVPDGDAAVLNKDGETTWIVGNRRLVPFPINIYDSREGLPQENNTMTPVPGIAPMAVTRNGVMNLVEMDMGNLGRLLKGDFDSLFSGMGPTAYRAQAGLPLRAQEILDNIAINQDNGWLIYISDRRGDEPAVSSNPNLQPDPARPSTSSPNLPSTIGDGEYNREDVLWNPGGSTSGGASASVDVKFGSAQGCTNGTPRKTDNQDNGKSPQDGNNDCWIQTETASGQFSETAPYSAMFNGDQLNPTLIYNDIGGPIQRYGAMVAMTQAGTNAKPAFSRKPPVVYQAGTANLRIETFRRGVRLVNASNIFPTGPVLNQQCSGNGDRVLLGLTMTSENPVYVFGNYNAPAAEVGDTDFFPGLSVTPNVNAPTSPARFNGDGNNCGRDCSIPSAVVADAITLLSGACVGNSNPVWGGRTGSPGGYSGWLDTRSFVMPYQAIGYRPARNTVYRCALISGFTPSWFPGFWNNPGPNVHQGPSLAVTGLDSHYSSGGVNNFPRFLEDWRFNGFSGQNAAFATYAGSLIKIYKSRQANGAFKRVSSADSVSAGHVEHVYVPPNRDWIFDVNFTTPCTLPPGSPFLQLLDFKGFQQSVVQQR